MKRLLKNKVIFILPLFMVIILNVSTNIFISYADDEDFEIESNSEPLIEYNPSNSKSLIINARSCVVLDRLTKKILYSKNETSQVKMASTTKIMTAIVVIENFDLSSTIEVTKHAANTGGSRLGLRTSDKVTIHDLLYGLMLCSGNDAAVALAEGTCGSVQAFADKMNKKAQSLNLSNTHFETPHGLDSDGHFTTAYELALLTDYALKNPTFSKIVGTKTTCISINGNPRNLHNTNELLGYLNGVYGVKTGFTNGANRCLVTACKRGDMDIITVVLGCDTKKFRTQDSKNLIEYIFDNYAYFNIEEKLNMALENWKAEHQNYFIYDKAKNENLEFNFEVLENPILPIEKSLLDNIKVDIHIDKHIYAPLYVNEKVGYITVSSNDTLILDKKIIASNTLEKKDIPFYMKDILTKFVMINF